MSVSKMKKSIIKRLIILIHFADARNGDITDKQHKGKTCFAVINKLINK
jgi:hypothetical protein